MNTDVALFVSDEKLLTGDSPSAFELSHQMSSSGDGNSPSDREKVPGY